MIELRLAIVCYGGVSLAVYMHGVTKELHKLVLASEALGREPTRTEPPFAPIDSAAVYWQFLKSLQDGPTGAVTGGGMRVVIDVVTGTSAGGINGVILAKALALNASQESLRSVWIDKGSILKILYGAGLLSRLKRLVPVSLLDGDWMLDQLVDVLARMDDSQPKTEPKTLLPPDVALDLFVTVTDLAGVRRRLPVHDPITGRWSSFDEAVHAHVLKFNHPNQATAGKSVAASDFLDNTALAFAARATSSFPVAFAPVRIGQVIDATRRRAQGMGRPADDRHTREAFERRYFPLYRLARQSIDGAAFIDGGVLHNKPFKPAVKAIVGKPAKTEVQRAVLYLEPDPDAVGEVLNSDSTNPLSVAWAALHGLPSFQPIADDLIELNAWNERLETLNHLVDATLAGRATTLVSLPPSPVSAQQIDELRDRVYDDAHDADPDAYGDYERLKVAAVIEQIADVICGAEGYPEGSLQAYWVHEAIQKWAEVTNVTRPTIARHDRRARAFLRAFDVGYRIRRLRFVIRALNRCYPDPGCRLEGDGNRPPRPALHDVKQGRPDREDLDRLKQALYGVIGDLDRLMNGRLPDPDLKLRVDRMFGLEVYDAYAKCNSQTPIDEFVDNKRGEITALANAFEAVLAAEGDRLNALAAQLLANTWDVGWHDAVARRLVLAYVAFPIWDIRIYPMNALAGVSDREKIATIRLSPNDATLLWKPGAAETAGKTPARGKLKGTTAFHFGAFFKRAYRENDYLWGRLDTAERIIDVLCDALPSDARPSDPIRRAFKVDAVTTVLRDERGTLTTVGDLITRLEQSIDARPAHGGNTYAS